MTAPTDLLPPNGLKGSNPNDLVLSRDGRTLLVSLGGINAVAVVDLEGKARGEEEDDDRRDHRGEGRRHDEKLGFRAEQSGPDGERSGRGHDDDEYEHGIGDVEDIGVVGLIPTAWYPHAVAVGTGNMIYVANGKSEAGPNPKGCRNTLSTAPDASAECSAANQYIWQLEKASLLSLPAPSGRELARLTWQTAYNNDFPIVQKRQDGDRLMGFLRERIKHVIYIIKENRTYDQVLGDLEVGNGDPALAIFPNRITPNHHQLARQFTTIDNFYDSGEVSNTGWSWSTAARATDMLEKSAPVNYAGRGLAYESEGTNRNINVAIPTSEERAKVNKLSPTDPDILPGTADLTAPDAPSGEAGEGFGQQVAPQRAVALVLHRRGGFELLLQVPLELGGDGGVAHHHRQLEVEPEAAVVEVGTADNADVVVGDERLGVQHARAVLVDLHAGMQQLIEVRARGLGDEPRIAHFRYQQAHVQAAQRGRSQRHPRRFTRHEIGRHQPHPLACLVDGGHVHAVDRFP